MTVRRASIPVAGTLVRAAGRAALLGCTLWVSACCHPDTQDNRAPVLQTLLEQVVDEGSSLDVLVGATDPDGDPILLSAEPLPANASFVNHGDGTATFAFAPDFTQAGHYPVVVTVTDGDLSSAGTLLVTVQDVNRPPVANAGGPYAGRAGEAISFDGAGSADQPAVSAGPAWIYVGWVEQAAGGVQVRVRRLRPAPAP